MKYLILLAIIILGAIRGLPASAAGLEVTLSASPATVKVGDNITYTGITKNTLTVGPVISNFAESICDLWSVRSNTVNIQVDNSLSGVNFIGHIPAGTTFVLGSVKKDGAPVTITPTGADFTVPIGDLAPLSQATVVYQVRVN